MSNKKLEVKWGVILPVPIISGNLEKLNICLSPPISYELLYPIAGALTNIFIFERKH